MEHILFTVSGGMYILSSSTFPCWPKKNRPEFPLTANCTPKIAHAIERGGQRGMEKFATFSKTETICPRV